jgi:hypothetical protein
MVGFDQKVDSGFRSWVYGKASWQAVYNAACLYAQPKCGDQRAKPDEIHIAVELLRLAISNRKCELVRPSEWIGIDPDLHGLRTYRGLSPELAEPRPDGEFEDFLRAQAARDFDPADSNDVGDPWFRHYLPRKMPPPGGGPPPSDESHQVTVPSQWAGHEDPVS